MKEPQNFEYITVEKLHFFSFVGVANIFCLNNKIFFSSKIFKQSSEVCERTKSVLQNYPP